MQTRDGSIIHKQEDEAVRPGEVPLSQQELEYLSMVKAESRTDALINLRFEVYLHSQGLKLSTIDKLKARKYFTAGFVLSANPEASIVKPGQS